MTMYPAACCVEKRRKKKTNKKKINKLKINIKY